ncbi:Fpg/Nei family DNA glycosylase [Arthrobacter sp. B2a2-09]|uniref:Fpg/Nei family DNA glycosylase n=1 Tax=Arthrobacter sp. B2a2-09 TaxID=2952822 RepID=UPI0022CD57F8|nr:DNA-formamidopyrimidine glycosylase family protein [Arthrobacter sp. B2a2-09]MCZ9883160.1 Fpg/Nei family DNA glycosylase [Arthrobacter sp. B2a2-09]
MPEGDSIWRAAAELHKALAGQALVSSDFRVPRFATLNLAGWTVSEVVPRGKHLLMRLLEPAEAGSAEASPDAPGPAEAGPPRRALTIHSHLKMEGSWQVYAPGGRWRKPGHTARCILRTATADVVGFSLGILEVIPTPDENRAVGHLGPDLLGPDWDTEEAVRRLRAAPDTPIGIALLDQRNLAGIGNIYRCEACFLTGVHPAAPVSAVKDPAGILEEAKVLLEANLGPGPRITRGTAYPGVRGMPRSGYWVYGREHQPCIRCGTPIRRGVLGPASGLEDRTIYFCPECQPSP